MGITGISHDASPVEKLAALLTVAVLVVSAAVVLSSPAAPLDHPYPDAPTYVQLSENIAAFDGYTIDLPGEPTGSRVPPGFPLMLAALSPVANVTVATALLTVVLMCAVMWSAWKAAGPVASLIAISVLMVAIVDYRFVGAVMSDLPAAGVLVLAFIAFQYGRPRLAGFLAGWTVWMRLSHVVIAASLPRRAWLPFVGALVGLALTSMAWGWGYESGHVEWSLSYLWSTADLTGPGTPEIANVPYYTRLLLGVEDMTLVPPGAVFIAAWAVWQRPERRFVVPLVVGSAAMYLPYFYQDARFMLGVAAFISIYCGVGIVDLVARWVPALEPSPTPTS